MDQDIKRTRQSWQAMKDRCTNPKTASYKKYGARGIAVCPQWMASFDAFIADMGVRPEGMTLDRRDSNAGYEPANCRWATPIEQARGCCGQLITFLGKTQSVNGWTRELGFGTNTLHRRLRSGWSVEAALTTPTWKTQPRSAA